MLRSKVWLELDGQFVLGEGGLALLHEINSSRSLTCAARRIGWSYRHAWGYLRNAEKRLDVVLTSPVAGKGRSRGTCLTPSGVVILRALSQIAVSVRNLTNSIVSALRDREEA